MSHYEVSYRGDKTGRKAICDLIRWFGLSKSKLIIGEMQKLKGWYARNKNHPDFDMMTLFGAMNSIDIAIAIGGVQGAPVRRLFAHYLGEDVLKAWMESD